MNNQLGKMVLFVQAWLIFTPVMFSSSSGASYYRHRNRKLANEYNPGFISIDCGATEDYFAENSGIFYETDRPFVVDGNGINGKISSVYNGGQGVPWRSLRSFPTGIKNCYTLKPEQGKNNKYLIRASFVYGNYDGNDRPPIFDVYLGANKWVTLDARNSSRFNWVEAIYVPLTDYINICLVNINTGIPFISLLELRHVNNSIYPIDSSSEILHMTRRYDIERSETNIGRFKSDPYDRFWQPLQIDPQNFKSWYPINISSTTDFQSSNNPYKIPAEVLINAAQTLNATSPLNYYLKAPSSNDKYCIYFHFAEISKTNSSLLRKQYVSSNGVNLSTPVTLGYLIPITIGPFPLSISSDGYFQFSIHATEDSDLPPILNAFEIFNIFKIPVSPTDPDDANAMMGIKEKYGVTRNWQGDPCVPYLLSWDGLNCSNDSPPRIISLNLSSSGLAGNIVPSISILTSLKSLDLSYNKLSGSVPEFLAQLPFLKELNLAGNKLTGPVPKSLREKSINGTLQLSLEENPDICQLDSCKNKKNSNYVVPIVAVLSSSVTVLIVASAIWWICKKKRQGGSGSSLMSKNRQFTYSEVVSITDNFKTIIGEGGFGKVYLGTLINGDRVAVKLRSASSNQGLKEFRSEAQLLMRVHHGNLVSLIGYCDDGQNMVLVYEYMANGDLKQNLTETNLDCLNWNERLQVARDAAQGLEYLHNGCKPPIIHRDVKPANILLNKDYQAKIADFGLSRDTNEDDAHTTNPAGTIAYMDPEYVSTRKLNKKSDVYSFGVVLLELITGQPAIIRNPDIVHIIHWIKPLIERGDIGSIVDPRLQGHYDPNSAWKAVEIAMSCLPPTAIQRPEMNEVLSELKECLPVQMARDKSFNMKRNDRSFGNSIEVGAMDIDSDISLFAR